MARPDRGRIIRFGAVTSVLVGGLGALVVVLAWVKLFPDLVRIKSGVNAGEIVMTSNLDQLYDGAPILRQ